jgi:hypothetical protein
MLRLLLPRSRRRRWITAALVLVGLLVAVVVAFALRVPISSDAMRRAVIDALAERLDAEVELGTLALHLLPRLHAEGTNLVIRHQRRHDVPPLISVKAFVVRGNLVDLWLRRVDHVRLDGLEIQIPPDRRSSEDMPDQIADPNDFVVTELVAADATLVMIPRTPAKAPRTWQIHTLRMESVSAHTAMPFTATLTNAVPPGQIETTGSFGPWSRAEPGHTPLGGSFIFDHADLRVFKGISGTLSSKGGFGGTLAQIEVQGQTDTPDFTITVGGNPVPLKTTYHAIVDGTDGDTRLERIDAMLAETPIVAIGSVLHVEGVKGREVVLDVTIEKGRLEDILRLAVHSPEPPMTGALTLETKFVLPPGDRDVVEKLRLDGGFTIDDGRFMDAKVQQQINELSVRASGKKEANVKAPRVTSDFSGVFALGDGVLRLSKVTFDVPGAIVELGGQYALQRETLSFSGNLFMEAKVSETVSGFKRLLLKIVDPLFRKNGQTVIPLKVSGTRDNPSFGLDKGRVFTR